MSLINLKLALRNLGRNKLYTFINISGLSVACAFCILTFWYVKNEQSFDNFHKDQERLFRVEQPNFFLSAEPIKKESSFFGSVTRDDDQKNMILTPAILASDLKTNFPQIENTVRLSRLGDIVVRVDNESFREKNENTTYADDNFFKVFNYPILYGNARTALSDPKSIVISERVAKKYFGYSNPIGRRLELPNDKMIFTVSAVAKDFPVNSSFQYDVIAPITADPYYNEAMKSGTNQFSYLLIAKLKEGADVNLLQARLRIFAKQYYKSTVDMMQKFSAQTKVVNADIILRPFADAHYNQSEGWGHYTSHKNIYQFVILSALILFIAGLNYILLTLTNTVSRSQDVGVRKTIGAGRLQIIWQYFTETQLLAFICVLAGFVLAVICIPFFNNLTSSAIHIQNIHPAFTITYLIILSIILGLIAGIYPALTMSGLKPLNIMRGFSTYRINPNLSKGLVVLQFIICVVLIISTIVISKQMKFVSTAQMGFDTDQVLTVQNPYGWQDNTKWVGLKEHMYNYVGTNPALAGITSTAYKFATYNKNGHIINGQREYVQSHAVDFNYFTFNHIPILKGRNFSALRITDSARIKLSDKEKVTQSSTVGKAVVINETLYKLLGKPPMDVINPALGALIIGVCKDYHTDDLTKQIAPAYHVINTHAPGYYWIKIKAGQSVAKALSNIHANWNKMTDNSPFTYSFMDENVKKSYDVYQRWMDTIDAACVVAILIACLGLFGLSGITTINRTKEIGIRKILGASVANLFLLINRSTFILAICAFVLAAPVALYLVNQWLDNFAYRITPDWSVFALSAMFTLFTAIIAVSYHTLNAASANPVKSLRNE